MTPSIDKSRITMAANVAIAKAATKEVVKLLKIHLESHLLRVVENVSIDQAMSTAIRTAEEFLEGIVKGAQLTITAPPPAAPNIPMTTTGEMVSPTVPTPSPATPPGPPEVSIIQAPAILAPYPDEPAVEPLPAPVPLGQQGTTSFPVVPILPTPVADLTEVPSRSVARTDRIRRTSGGWRYSFSPISAESSPLPTPVPTSVPVGAQGIIPVPIWPAPLAVPNEPNGEIPGRGL